MQYIFFFAILLFYIYRTLTQAQKKAKLEAEQRRRANQQLPNQPSAPAAPKTVQEVLAEVFKETEMKTKPFGDGRKFQTMAEIKKMATQQSAQRTATVTPAIRPELKKKKETKPFLTNDYSPQPIAPEGTSSGAMEDYIKKSAVKDAYLISSQAGGRSRFNLRDAVIAKIILDRPEW